VRRNGRSVRLIRAGPPQYRTVTAKLMSAVSWRPLRGKRRYISRTARMNVLWAEPTSLLLEHFFDLSDLFLNFAGVFFDVAFGL
jgi:hypothetical protein